MTLRQAAAVLGRKGGAKGGKSRSLAKQEAARANGRKGGRKPLAGPLAKARAKVRRKISPRPERVGGDHEKRCLSQATSKLARGGGGNHTKARPAKQGKE